MTFDCAERCAFHATSAGSLRFPLGQLHRVASPTPSAGGAPGEVDETKRNVLKLLLVAGALGAGGGGLVGGTLQFAQPPAVGLSSYPKVQLRDLDGSPLTVAKAEAEFNVMTADVITFYYPLRNEPNFFLNLAPQAAGGPGATNVPYGVGTQKSLVAYSAICQHLGCPAPAIAYYPPGTCSENFSGQHPFYIHCSCHGSTYDVANSASNLTGPAVLPLPQVILEVDPSDSSIYAIGVTPNSPPVNGHFDTLQGDYGVGTASPLRRQPPPTPLCSFPS
jgi:Rieske Fe-S protein